MPMRTTNPYDFILIGLLVRFLRNCPPTALKEVLEGSAALVTRLGEIGFHVSVAGTHKLQEFISGLEKEPDKSRAISSEETEALSIIVGEVEHMIFAESDTKQLYLLSENRFNLDALLNKPASMFAAGIFDRIPRIAKRDIALAFQCLAFDQPTAAAFHLMRACEAVLRAYYFSCVRRDRLKNPMWAGMLEALRKRKRADEKLLRRLEYIKDTFRNPTAHPEAMYTISEAQDLIGICIDVINRMGHKLPDLEMSPKVAEPTAASSSASPAT